MIGEGGEAVLLCITEGERSEPSDYTTTAHGPRRGPTLARVRPLRGHPYGYSVLQVRLAHPQLSIVERLRRPLSISL